MEIRDDKTLLTTPSTSDLDLLAQMLERARIRFCVSPAYPWIGDAGEKPEADRIHLAVENPAKPDPARDVEINALFDTEGKLRDLFVVRGPRELIPARWRSGGWHFKPSV